MNPTQCKAMEQALEALWVCAEHNALHHGDNHNTVIQALSTLAALRAALAEQPAEQEPEGSVCGRCGGLVFDPVLPQPAKREPLTDEAVIDLIPSAGIRGPIDALWFARAIERAHGIGVSE